MHFKISQTAWAASVLIAFATSSVHAVNECGPAAANAATCNGDGSPVTDANPYANGITYTGAAGSNFLLNLDGTVTPLNIKSNASALTGVLASAPNGFIATYNLLGQVTVDRTVTTAANLNVGVGPSSSVYSPGGITMNLGAQSVVKLTRTVASNYSLYGIAAFANNNPINITSAAAITVDANSPTIGSRPFAVGIATRDFTAGPNSSMNVVSTGPILVKTVTNGSSAITPIQAQGIGTFIDAPGSTLISSVTNGGSVTINNTGAASQCSGISSNNSGTGGNLVTNNGPIIIDGDCGSSTSGASANKGYGPNTVLVNAPLSVTVRSTTPTGSARGASISGAGTGTIIADADITVVTNATTPTISSASIYVASTATVPDPANPKSEISAPAGAYTITVNAARTVSMNAAGGTAIGAYSPAGGTINLVATSVVANLAGAIGNSVTAGNGPDVLTTAGTVTGVVAMGRGNDKVNLTGGSLTGDIYGDARAGESATDGNDDLTWSAGTWNNNFYGQNGSDTVTITPSAPYTGSNVLDGGDDVSAADGWVDVLTLQGQTVSTPGANLLNWERIVLANSTALTLTGSSLTVGSEAGLGLDVNSGTSLRTTGAFSITGNVLNQGTLTQQNGNAGDKLTVSGTYTGGGTLHLDVVFNEGNASTSADQLAVVGDVVSSPTTLNLTNVSGLGAATTGNGILLITVTGNSPAGAFVLAGPGYVDVNGYRYSLVQVGKDWYLQSLPAPVAPSIVKSAKFIDATTIEWTITVVNNAASNASLPPVSFAISDILSNKVTAVPGAVVCTPTGSATATACGLSAGNTALNVTGTLPYTADTSLATAAQRLTIVFRGTVAAGTSAANTACVNLTGQSEQNCSTSAAPGIPGTINPVPVNAPWMLSLMALLLAGLGAVLRPQRR